MITLENDVLCLEIAEQGAELVRVFDKRTNRERVWDANDTYWSRVSPVLFPIVGRVKDGYTLIDGKRYDLTQHGFLRDQLFTVELENETAATLVHTSDSKFLDIYPFEFEVRLGYELKENQLVVKWEVENVGEKTMYYCIGGHPAFMMESGRNYHFRLQGKEVSFVSLEEGHVSKLTPVEEIPLIDVNYENFKNDATIYSNIDVVELINDENVVDVRVECYGFDFVGLWGNTKHGHMSPFVCIEPWLGITDDVDSNHEFVNKRGIRSVEVSKIDSNQYTIIF